MQYTLDMHATTAGPSQPHDEAADLPLGRDSMLTIEREEDLSPFVALLRADNGRGARLVRKLALHIPSLSPNNFDSLVGVVQQLTEMTTLSVLYAELLFNCCPRLSDCVVRLASLQDIKWHRAGPIAYSVAARMHSRLVSVEIHGFPGYLARWTHASLLLLRSADTLRTIDIPNVALDLREHAVQFPQAELVHLTYDRPEVLDLRSYMFAFPNLQEFRITVVPAQPGPPHVEQVCRMWNLQAATQDRRWAALKRVHAPPHELWLLGLHQAVEKLSLPVDRVASAQSLHSVLVSLSPRYLSLLCRSAEDACAVIHNFGTLLAPWSVPRLTTLVLAVPLPLDVRRFAVLVLALVQNVAVLQCEELTVQFSDIVSAEPPHATLWRPAYIAQTRWDELAQSLLNHARTSVKRVTVIVSPPSPFSDSTVYIATALP